MGRALILGGSGGLSGTLAALAEKVFDEVWVLTRGRRPVEGSCIGLSADRNQPREFEKAVLGAGDDWDVVFDCICMNEVHAKQDIDIVSRRTNRLVVVSTDSVYASEYKKVLQAEEGVFVDEVEGAAIPEYARDKREMEKVFEAYMNDKNQSMQVTIFRPGHIFGPRMLFGCFPLQSRQKELPEIMEKGQIFLVGGGCYLLHPIYVEDLARVMLDCVENEKTFQQIYCIGGPEIIENKRYYQQLAEVLGVKAPEILEVPLTGFLEKFPEYYGHLCHRAYDLSKLKETGIAMPATGLKEGLERQWEYSYFREK